jgi:type I restriction enzyme S subunit
VPVFSGTGLLGFCGNALHRGATIVVGRVGAHCGAIHLVSEEECWITDAALYVYEARPEVDLRFLSCSLRRLDLTSLRTTDRQALISLSTIYPLLLALPPLEEQREICALMSAVETLRDAQDRVLAHVRRVRAALLAAAPA